MLYINKQCKSIISLNKNIFILKFRKRHHEDNPYSSSDGGGGVTSHSVPKRIATRNSSQSKYILINNFLIIEISF